MPTHNRIATRVSVVSAGDKDSSRRHTTILQGFRQPGPILFAEFGHIFGKQADRRRPPLSLMDVIK
jgi:hypothetical protein